MWHQRTHLHGHRLPGLSDAGALLISGHSPYERRPFATLVLAHRKPQPNGAPVAAKLFFCCCDGAVGLMMALQ